MASFLRLNGLRSVRLCVLRRAGVFDEGNVKTYSSAEPTSLVKLMNVIMVFIYRHR